MGPCTLQRYTPLINDPQSPKKFEIEDSLLAKQVLQQMDAVSSFSFREKVSLFRAAYVEDCKTKPWETAAKTIVSLIGLSALFPNLVGSFACLKTLQVVPLKEMDSKDLSTAYNAVQDIGNAGMAVTYLLQLRGFVFHPISLLFIETYNEKAGEELFARAKKILTENYAILTPVEKEFLEERLMRLFIRSQIKLPRLKLPLELDQIELEVARKEDSISIEVDSEEKPSDEENEKMLEEIQEEICLKMKTDLSMKTIIPLVGKQMFEDIKTSPCTQTGLKIAKSAFIVGLAGASITVLSIGTYGCFKPFDLQSPLELESSNSVQVQNAVANYSNAGHGLEYLAVAGVLGWKALKYIVWPAYRKVAEKQIRDVYTPEMRSPKQSKEVSNQLYDCMYQEMSERGLS